MNITVRTSSPEEYSLSFGQILSKDGAYKNRDYPHGIYVINDGRCFHFENGSFKAIYGLPGENAFKPVTDFEIVIKG